MIKKLHQQIQSGEVKALDLIKEYLERIEKRNSSLNAYLRTYQEEALTQAQEVDDKVQAGQEISILEGIPYALKDNICVQGTITSSGSKMLENYRAPYDATVVTKLKKQGAVLLGKTNLDEFAMGSSTENSAFGVTKNPHDETRVAGGSSGGSAAAAAADLAVYALGSDTGGSVRQPASLCGVVGFKPTYGRVSRYGLAAMASSYDQISPLTQSVEDAAVVFEAIAGRDPKDNTSVEKNFSEKFPGDLEGDLKGKKIGYCEDFFGMGLDEQSYKLIHERIDWAKEQGAEIVKIELPNFKHSLAIYYLMQTSEVSSNMARIDGIRYGLNKSEEAQDLLEVYEKSRSEGIGEEVQRRIILGTYALSAGFYDAYYGKAQKVRELIKRELYEAFQKVDVLISPTSPTPAFKIGEKTDNPLAMYLADIYTVSTNTAMIPAISIPAGMAEVEGKQLPVGLQLLGKWWDEEKLLGIAKGFELRS